MAFITKLENDMWAMEQLLEKLEESFRNSDVSAEVNDLESRVNRFENGEHVEVNSINEGVIGRRVSFMNYENPSVEVRNRVAGLVHNLNTRQGTFEVGIVEKDGNMELTVPQGALVSPRYGTIEGIIHTTFVELDSHTINNKHAYALGDLLPDIYWERFGRTSFRESCTSCDSSRKRKIVYVISNYKRGTTGTYCKSCAIRRGFTEEQLDFVNGLVDIDQRKLDGKKSRANALARRDVTDVAPEGYNGIALNDLTMVDASMVSVQGDVISVKFESPCGDLTEWVGSGGELEGLRHGRDTYYSDYKFNLVGTIERRFYSHGKWYTRLGSAKLVRVHKTPQSR